MDKRVRINRDGSLIVILDLDILLCDRLKAALTYKYLRHLRGREAYERNTRVEVSPVRCYQFITDPTGVMDPQLVTAYGYLDIVAETIRSLGRRPVIKDISPKVDPIKFVPQWDRLEKMKFRWKQKEVLEMMVKHQNGRVGCPPGFGKSFLIYCACLMWPKAKIDISTHSVDVIRQIYDELNAKLPSVGMVGGGKKKYGERVTCYSGKSLHHSDGDADVLIVDEVHEVATKQYMRSVARFKYARRFGFSANIDDRMDGSDFELLGSFGPARIVVSYPEAVKHGCVVPIQVHWRNVIMDSNPCSGYNDTVAKERWGIWRNSQRNAAIAAAVKEYEEEQVLVVVATVEHACFLKRHLPDYTLCYSEGGLTDSDRARYIKLGLIMQDEPVMTMQRRIKLKEDFTSGKLKKVIATGVWNRGVDFQRLAVLVRADAKASAICDMQIPGRVTRLFAEGEKQHGVVIDFKDQFDKGYKRKAYERRSRYQGNGWTQHEPVKDNKRRLLL